jgi:hypothetical protein
VRVAVQTPTMPSRLRGGAEVTRTTAVSKLSSRER